MDNASLGTTVTNIDMSCVLYGSSRRPLSVTCFPSRRICKQISGLVAHPNLIFECACSRFVCIHERQNIMVYSRRAFLSLLNPPLECYRLLAGGRRVYAGSSVRPGPVSNVMVCTPMPVCEIETSPVNGVMTSRPWTARCYESFQ